MFLGLNLEVITNKPIHLLCYSQAILKNDEATSKYKHIEIYYHVTFDILLMRKILVVNHIPTSKMIVNLLTKALITNSFLIHVHSMGFMRD